MNSINAGVGAKLKTFGPSVALNDFKDLVVLKDMPTTAPITSKFSYSGFSDPRPVLRPSRLRNYPEDMSESSGPGGCPTASALTVQPNRK